MKRNRRNHSMRGRFFRQWRIPLVSWQGKAKRLIKTLGETGGIGTVATRADVIEKLFNSFLIEKEGKGLHVTSKGKQLLQLAPEDLRFSSTDSSMGAKVNSDCQRKATKTGIHRRYARLCQKYRPRNQK